MPIGFGMASSHAPSLFAETYDAWNRIWERFRVGNEGPPELHAVPPPRSLAYVQTSPHTIRMC
jgi:hypothetical protein